MKLFNVWAGFVALGAQMRTQADAQASDFVKSDHILGEIYDDFNQEFGLDMGEACIDKYGATHYSGTAYDKKTGDTSDASLQLSANADSTISAQLNFDGQLMGIRANCYGDTVDYNDGQVTLYADGNIRDLPNCGGGAATTSTPPNTFGPSDYAIGIAIGISTVVVAVAALLTPVIIAVKECKRRNNCGAALMGNRASDSGTSAGLGEVLVDPVAESQTTDANPRDRMRQAF